MKSIPIPYDIGDLVWVLVSVKTWAHKPCPECGGKGCLPTQNRNKQKCEPCKGSGEKWEARSTYYTQPARVTGIEYRRFTISGNKDEAVSEYAIWYTLAHLYADSQGGPSDERLRPCDIWLTEQDAINAAKERGYEWYPTLKSKRPRGL